MTPAVGRVFFAIALAGFGVLQFIFGDFIPGRAPEWPAGAPGRWLWASISGALLIISAAAVMTGKWARQAALLTGTMILLWALVRHFPLLVANPHGIVLTKTGKALALSGGAFALASDRLLPVGRWCLGGFMILGGIQHFQFTDFVATLVPAWIPGARFWTYFAAVALIAGGIGLLVPRTARLAGALSGLMLLLWVLLLHIPRALAAADIHRRNEWTAVFEALAFSGIAFVIAAGMRRDAPDSSAMGPTDFTDNTEKT